MEFTSLAGIRWRPTWAHVAVSLEKLLRKPGQNQGVPEIHRERFSFVALERAPFFPACPVGTTVPVYSPPSTRPNLNLF